MTSYVALLRAVNVGGTGKLPMSELRVLCEAAAFKEVRTYIASGNVVFQSRASERDVKGALENRLLDYFGKSVNVMIRTSAEMVAIVKANPFPGGAPNRTVAIFLDDPPPSDTLDGLVGQSFEEVQLGKREVYIHYGSRMADSKLKIAAARTGTARNMNTVARLASMATG
ncbi:MAG: DUF1697 domain-containing protein [Pseudomonadota bacterium]